MHLKLVSLFVYVKLITKYKKGAMDYNRYFNFVRTKSETLTQKVK